MIQHIMGVICDDAHASQIAEAVLRVAWDLRQDSETPGDNWSVVTCPYKDGKTIVEARPPTLMPTVERNPRVANEIATMLVCLGGMYPGRVRFGTDANFIDEIEPRSLSEILKDLPNGAERLGHREGSAEPNQASR